MLPDSTFSRKYHHVRPALLIWSWLLFAISLSVYGPTIHEQYRGYVASAKEHVPEETPPPNEPEGTMNAHTVLVKLRKEDKNKPPESLTALLNKHAVKRFARVAREGKKSRTDADIFSWYRVTRDDVPAIIHGTFDTKSKKIHSNDPKTTGLNHLIQELASNPAIEAVEPDYIATLDQTDSESPTAPQNVTAVATSPSTVDVHWDAATDNVGVAQYIVYRGTIAVASTQSLTATDRHLIPGSSNSYSVVAKDAAGNVSPVSNSVTVTMPADTEPPTAPSNLTAEVVNATTITLRWDPATDNGEIGAYRVYRNGVLLIYGNVLTYTNTNLTPGTTYTYYIQAQDSIGNVGPASNQVTVTTPSVPTVTAQPTLTPNPSVTPPPVGSTPNDPYYWSAGSWGQSYDDMWGMKKIRMSNAWLTATGSADVVVAVVDDGIDRNHPDLVDNIWVNTNEIPGNGIDDDGNGFIDDYYGWSFATNSNNTLDGNGHAAHVAGIIAAVGNNGQGVVGVNWKAKLMSVAMFNASTGTMAWGASAIQYAVDMGAQVINNSWTCSCTSLLVDDALRYAHDHGVVVVSAAGNDNVDALNKSPASSDYTITVAASDMNDARSNWGNGQMSNVGEKLDVAAPGTDILSTKSSFGGMCYSSVIVNTMYCRMGGTSMSTPHVSGLAALLLSKNPSLSPETIRQIIRLSVVDIGAAGKDSEFGYGRIDAASAVALANASIPSAFIAAPISRSSIYGMIPVMGTAASTQFAQYIVEVGAGRSPGSWTTIATSSSSVVNGQLAMLDTTTLAFGSYTIRLTVEETTGRRGYFQVFDVSVTASPPSATPTPLPTSTPTRTPTPLPSATPTITLTPTRTPTPLPTSTPTRTPTVTPVPDTTLPLVTMTSPKNGARVTRNKITTISASASDNWGVTRVEFFVNNVLTCTDTAAAYTCAWSVPNTRNVSYTLRATAFDAAGNAGSHTISVKSN